MNNSFDHYYKTLYQWAQKAHERGWLSADEFATLEQIEHQSIDSLFAAKGHRPLITAFFGGTGVGKSSLMNRLVGENLANVSVERPTSHEVTLYLHEDYPLESLPGELPSTVTRIAYHHNDRHRLVAWLDLPDMDSTEGKNREMVNNWLPYVDWLVYVVSPERYKDDAGWRYLEERSRRHAWLFVMNHWDQGCGAQIEDFRTQLLDQGFENPHILRTICGGKREDDDFKQLEQLIQGAITEYGLELLQNMGVHACFVDLLGRIREFSAIIGPKERWNRGLKVWESGVAGQLDKLTRRMFINMEMIMANLQAEKLNNVRQWKNMPNIDPQTITGLAQDVWSTRSDDILQELHAILPNAMQQAELPFKYLFDLFDDLPLAGPEMVTTIEDNLLDAVTKPGHPLQRTAYKITGMLTWMLPLAMSLWVGFNAVAGFQAGVDGEKEFLGQAFAVNGAILIVLACLPFLLLHFKLRPNRTASLKQGLNNGITAGANLLNEQYRNLWNRIREQRDKYIDELEKIATDVRKLEQGCMDRPDDFIQQFSKAEAYQKNIDPAIGKVRQEK